jgi:hypothetical protein
MTDNQFHDNSGAPAPPASHLGPSLQDAIADHLSACGYSVRFQLGAWCECLVCGHGEAWHGRGLDPMAARENALRLMLPSVLARRAFEEMASANVQLLAVAAHQASLGGDDVAVAVEQLTVTTAHAGLSVHEPVAIAPIYEEAQQPAITAEESADGQAEFAAALALVEEPEPVLPWNPHDVLDGIIAEINVAGDDIALYAPDRLKLEMARWMCLARAVQVDADDFEVSERVRKEVAARLHKLSKVLWPGSIPALQMNTTPVGMSDWLGGVASTWASAAGLASDLLKPIDGEDEFGWADADPAVLPPSPGQLLARAREEFDGVFGKPLDIDSATMKALVERKRDDAGIADRLHQVAKMLRWVRTVVPDPQLWGVLMGQLRWIVQIWRLPQTEALARAVSSRYAPKEGWAKLLGYDPKEIEERRRHEAVMRARPDAGADEAAVVDWFKQAAEVLDADALAPLLKDHEAMVLGLDVMAVFPGKPQSRFRDRLRKVQTRLREHVAPTALPKRTVVLPTRPDTTNDDAPVSMARSLVAGKRALVVGNRADTELKEKLEEMLGLEVIWCDATQHKTLQAHRQRVRGGGVDLVLALTGFMDHCTEGPLREAAKAGGVMYVACYKGRLLTTARSILMSFGVLRPGGFQAVA